MENRLLITRWQDKILSALYEDRDMIQVHVESAEGKLPLGSIYVGKVKNIVKNINAAFVEIDNGTMCYLSLRNKEFPIYAGTLTRQDGRILTGDEILVQVVREDLKTKLPSVTCNLNLTGRYTVLTRGKNQISISAKITDADERARLQQILCAYQNEEYGFIARTNSKGVPEEIIQQEAENLRARYEELCKFGIHKTSFSKVYEEIPGYLKEIRDGYTENIQEIVTDDKTLYEAMQAYLNQEQSDDIKKLRFYEDEDYSLKQMYHIEGKLQKALQPKVWLKSGGSVVIQPTEALVSIDVNTGKAVTKKKDVEETFYKVNMEAAAEIAKQIRLRNLSGIIIIDFIDMKDKDRQKELMKHLKKCLDADPLKAVVVDMTALGLVEITRKKVRKPLYEMLKLK